MDARPPGPREDRWWATRYPRGQMLGHRAPHKVRQQDTGPLEGWMLGCWGPTKMDTRPPRRRALECHPGSQDQDRAPATALAMATHGG